MSEQTKPDPNNPYDQIREEMREKQKVEAERQTAVGELFNNQTVEILDRLKGVKR